MLYSISAAPSALFLRLRLHTVLTPESETLRFLHVYLWLHEFLKTFAALIFLE